MHGLLTCNLEIHGNYPSFRSLQCANSAENRFLSSNASTLVFPGNPGIREPPAFRRVDLGKGLGDGIRHFKNAMREGSEPATPAATAPTAEKTAEQK